MDRIEWGKLLQENDIACNEKPVDEITQKIADIIWKYFEKHDLTNDKKMPILLEGENDASYADAYPNALIIGKNHFDKGFIILEEMTHYIRRKNNEPELSRDFSPKFLSFIAFQTGLEIDCPVDKSYEVQRTYQTYLLENWWKKIELEKTF